VPVSPETRARTERVAPRMAEFPDSVRTAPALWRLLEPDENQIGIGSWIPSVRQAAAVR